MWGASSPNNALYGRPVRRERWGIGFGAAGIGVTLLTTALAVGVEMSACVLWLMGGVGVLLILGAFALVLVWQAQERRASDEARTEAKRALQQLDDAGTVLLHLREEGRELEREMSYLSTGEQVSDSEIAGRIRDWTVEVWDVVKIHERDIAHEFYTAVEPRVGAPDPTEARMPPRQTLATWLTALEHTNTTIQRKIAEMRAAEMDA